MILATVEALQAVGVRDITVDLALPTLVPLILAAAGDIHDARLRTALDHKDIAEISAAGGSVGALLTALVEASGPFADGARTRGQAQTSCASAQAEWDRLAAVARAVHESAPDLAFDGGGTPLSAFAGFEYRHTGVTFSLFAKGAQREIGRGGRYRLNHGGEQATGATLLVDTLLHVVPPTHAVQRLWVPFGTPRSEIRAWQSKGWIVVAGLEAGPAADAEARRLGCSHFLADGDAVAVSSATVPNKRTGKSG